MALSMWLDCAEQWLVGNRALQPSKIRALDLLTKVISLSSCKDSETISQISVAYDDDEPCTLLCVLSGKKEGK